MVCGACLPMGAPFESDVRNSEVCSDRCYNIYMDQEEAEPEESEADDDE